MKFYGFFRSSAAYRCRIALNLKGVKSETAAINLRASEQRAPEFLKLNPQGLVPALEADGHLLTQSLAIIEWLEETHPTPALLPRDPFERAHVRALALQVACDIHPLQNLRVLKYVKATYGQDQTGLDSWCRHWVETGLNAFEATLAASGKSGAFCFGDSPGLADVCLVPQMFSAARFNAKVANLSHIARVMKSCDAHPAFANAHPSCQPDATA